MGDRRPYRTDKRPVRMDYLDDIDLPEFSRLPTFKRICICILKNDHACKYMGFSPNKSERQRRKKIMEKYESLLRIPDWSDLPESVYNVRAVPVEKVVANSYNPNVVAPPEMKLLELSIWEDGYDAVRLLLRCGARRL